MPPDICFVLLSSKLDFTSYAQLMANYKELMNE